MTASYDTWERAVRTERKNSTSPDFLKIEFLFSENIYIFTQHLLSSLCIFLLSSLSSNVNVFDLTKKIPSSYRIFSSNPGDPRTGYAIGVVGLHGLPTGLSVRDVLDDPHFHDAVQGLGE